MSRRDSVSRSICDRVRAFIMGISALIWPRTVGEIVGIYEVGKMGSELAEVVRQVSLYRRLFAYAVHPVALDIRSRVGFGQAALDPARHCLQTNVGRFRALAGRSMPTKS